MNRTSPHHLPKNRAQALVEFLSIIGILLASFFFLFEYVLLSQAKTALNMAAYAAAKQYSLAPASVRSKVSKPADYMQNWFGDDFGIKDYTPLGLASNQAYHHLQPFIKRGILGAPQITLDPASDPGYGQPQTVTVSTEVTLADLPFFRKYYATDSSGKKIMKSRCLTIME